MPIIEVGIEGMEKLMDGGARLLERDIVADSALFMLLAMLEETADAAKAADLTIFEA